MKLGKPTKFRGKQFSGMMWMIWVWRDTVELIPQHGYGCWLHAKVLAIERLVVLSCEHHPITHNPIVLETLGMSLK